MATTSTTYFSKLSSINRIDSEYFNPAFLELEETLSKTKTIPITALTSVSDGNHMSISKYFTESDDGIPYYRGQDVNDFFLENADPYKISNEAFNKGWMYRSHFRSGDVLLSIVGTVGSLAYVTDRIKASTGSCKIAIIRPSNKIDGRFLSAFLKSKYGQFQIKRNVRGAVQTGLILKDMVFIRVPEVELELQEPIANLIQRSIDENYKSKALYTQATQLLENALGLNKIEFKKEKSYIASFSEVVSNNRADADYYQTKYRQLAEHLNTIDTVRLGSICNIKKGYEVGSAAYTNEGPLFIRVSNLNNEGFSQGNSDKYISKNLYQTLNSYQPNIGDILLTKDGTIGSCYVVDEQIEGIISSGILNLTLLDSEIPKEYLALVINSKACSMQANRDCSGALILHWKPEDIRKLKIPILSDSLMHKLSELVINSKKARKESKQLLELAKKEVEGLIENTANQ